MQSWEDQLAEILAQKGVQMEQPADPESTITIFQHSQKHSGVLCRLDLIDETPHVRLILPIDDGRYKINLYHIQLAPNNPLSHLFSLHMALEGSSAFQEERGIVEHALLVMYGDLLQALFWRGDLNTMQFPSEIRVLRLI